MTRHTKQPSPRLHTKSSIYHLPWLNGKIYIYLSYFYIAQWAHITVHRSKNYLSNICIRTNVSFTTSSISNGVLLKYEHRTLALDRSCFTYKYLYSFLVQLDRFPSFSKVNGCRMQPVLRGSRVCLSKCPWTFPPIQHTQGLIRLHCPGNYCNFQTRLFHLLPAVLEHRRWTYIWLNEL